MKKQKYDENLGLEKNDEKVEVLEIKKWRKLEFF